MKGTDQHRAAPSEEVLLPPAPSGESNPEAVPKAQAVADALIDLGENADPKHVAEAIKRKSGLVLEPGEVAKIQRAMRKRCKTAPGPDQPPPENARRED